MRALVVMSSLATGGAERVTVSLLRQLVEGGAAVALCTVTDLHDGALAREVDESGIPRYDLGARRIADLRAVARLVRLIRRFRPDVVHAHGQDASILAALVHRLHSGRLAITRHVLAEPDETLRQRLRARATLRALRRANAVVAVSGAVRDRLIADGIPARRIRVIPNGIDLDRLDAHLAVADSAALRRDLGLDPRDQALLLPAVLRPGKGHRALIDAMGPILQRVPAARLLLAGTGPLEDELRGAAEPIAPAARLLGHRNDVPALMAMAELVVLPSEAEALPTVLMEAAAASTAVVATRVGGVEEVVADGETGLLVPPRDTRALAAAVVELLLDPERARRLGSAARRRAEARFGLQPYATATMDLWRSMAGERER